MGRDSGAVQEIDIAKQDIRKYDTRLIVPPAPKIIAPPPPPPDAEAEEGGDQ